MRRIGLAALAVMAATPAMASEQDFTVVNASQAPITFIYIAADYETGWGSDALSNSLPPGQSVFIRVNGYRNHCAFRVVIEDASGGEAILDRIDLCTVKTITYE